MAHHTAQLQWQRQEGEAFTDQRYSRRHTLRFDGGVVIAGSSSPSVVPLPHSDASAVDPEEMFVASLSSCPCFGSSASPPAAAMWSTPTKTMRSV